MSKGKYPLGDAKARRAARKQRKTQKAAVRAKGGTQKGLPKAGGQGPS